MRWSHKLTKVICSFNSNKRAKKIKEKHAIYLVPDLVINEAWSVFFSSPDSNDDDLQKRAAISCAENCEYFAFSVRSFACAARPRSTNDDPSYDLLSTVQPSAHLPRFTAYFGRVTRACSGARRWCRVWALIWGNTPL